MSEILPQSITSSWNYVRDQYNERPVLISLFITLLYTGGSVAALIVEAGHGCNPDLKLWLGTLPSYHRPFTFFLYYPLESPGVITVFAIIRWILRLVLELVIHGYVIFTDSITAVVSVIEMFNIFGVVWFSVGNLLIFNGI